jgi:Tc toxin complex TcA C-terminal TcB-binding domain
MAGGNQTFHEAKDDIAVQSLTATKDARDTEFTYTFENFFHPFVGELIQKLNKESLTGLFDPDFHAELGDPAKTPDSALPGKYYTENPAGSKLVDVIFHNKAIDLDYSLPYANYNWELFFHIPLMVAVHLSKNQRFAEAQRWFHYIFNPVSNNTSVSPPQRYWNFLAFRQEHGDPTQIDELLALLSTPDNEIEEENKKDKQSILDGYQEILKKPFQPYPVLRTRLFSAQCLVVMKYLDNLIAWGDHLFRQDTMESINEATQIYVLAANILGARPQRIPPAGTMRPRTFAELKAKGLDPMGNTWVELEGAFPFNFGLPQTQGVDPNVVDSLFGIVPTLYFCIPRNEKLLSYWDTVADRLFKIRHCMNIEGVVRQLALFDPPIDPGMLVKAAAAGIDSGSSISGLNQPIGPVRSLFLIQKALELASEVRGLGAALLSAIEKGDGERLAMLRQGHEIKIQQMQQEVRFLQWKQAQESTESLLRSRTSALEKYSYYLRLLGQRPDSNVAPETLTLDRRELTEENFDEAYTALVEQYEKAVPLQLYPPLSLAGETSPANQSLLAGQGKLYLNTNEDADLNEHAPESRRLMNAAYINDSIAEAFVLLPDININIHYWGIGSTTDIPIGELFARASRIVSGYLNTESKIHDSEGSSASKTASYERRADDWIFQSNLAARELMQIGRQILGSLIAEQVARREYLNIQKQIEHSEEVDRFLREKYTNEELYAWMQGEITRLYYEYYRFAFDTARKAQLSMKLELMRPEVDSTDYVKFNYWDGGRKGLLSGEALYLDTKRMEMAYHENNKREFELTKHVSLRQLNPLALLTLKAEGCCEVTVPEWLFDLECPGHYMRRIKNVSLSIPSVAGPYTSVSCTLSLLKSSLRKSPLLKDDEYARQGSEDDRFIDYFGTIQSIVTSSGNNDSGMFETNLRDERFLPFEGAGAISTWKLELPKNYRAFDYNTISDVILHIRYTARQGGAPLGGEAVKYIEELVSEANTSGLALLFSLRHEFPTEWHRFTTGTGNFEATVKRDHFAYFTRGKQIAIDSVKLHAIKKDNETFKVESNTPPGLEQGLAGLAEALNNESQAAFVLSLAEDPAGPDAVLERKKDAIVFLSIKYSLTS